MAPRQKANKDAKEIERRTPLNALTLTRKDVARRELVAAIKLFFEDGDPVVVHLLAKACHDIVAPIAKRAGKVTLRETFENRVREEYQDSWRRLMKEAYNFFKHGGGDPETTLTSFDPAINEHVLFECCNDYALTFGEGLPAAAAFQAWFFSRSTNLLTDEGLRFYEPLIAPLRDMSEAAKMNFIRAALADSEL